MADEINREGSDERPPVRAEIRRTTVQTAVRPPFIRRVSWGAIIAGAIVAISCQLLLTTLGLAIGMATVNPLHETNAANGLATGAGVWWLVSGLISLFIGGLVAGRMAGFSRWVDGMLHGLTVWGLTAVASLFMLTTSLANLIGGAVGGLQQVASAAAGNPDLTSTVTNDTGATRTRGANGASLADKAQNAWDTIKREANDAIQKASGSATEKTAGTPSTGDQSVDQVLTSLLKKPGGPSASDRQAAIDLLVNQAGMDRDEAQRTVDRWENAYAQANAGGGRIYASPESAGGANTANTDTRRAEQQAANTVTNAAIWAFIALLLGAIAAALGGWIGKPSRTLLAEERVGYAAA
jgi:hypothetical protein